MICKTKAQAAKAAAEVPFWGVCLAYQDCDSLPTVGFALDFDFVSCLGANEQVMSASGGWSAILGLAGEGAKGHVSAALSLAGNLKGSTEPLSLWKYDWDKKGGSDFKVMTTANFRGAIKLSTKKLTKDLLGADFPVELVGSASLGIQVYDAYKDKWGFQATGEAVLSLVIDLSGKVPCTLQFAPFQSTPG